MEEEAKFSVDDLTFGWEEQAEPRYMVPNTIASKRTVQPHLFNLMPIERELSPKDLALQKRKKAQLSERERRNRMNEKMDELKKVITTITGGDIEMTKEQVIESAATTLVRLCEQLEILQREIQTLKEAREESMQKETPPFKKPRTTLTMTALKRVGSKESSPH